MGECSASAKDGTEGKAETPGNLPEVAGLEPRGPACIDVGGNMGALILRANQQRTGREVEIHPIGEPTNRTHVFVLARSTASGVTHAALFPSLRVGRYEVLGLEGSPCGVVEVEAGRVTMADWC